MLKSCPNYASYFTEPSSTGHKQYLALRKFFVDGFSAEQIASETGYSVSTVYSMVRDFKEAYNETEEPFFKLNKIGRKPIDHKGDVEETVINLRKKYYSVPDIQIALDALGIKLTVYSIEKIIKEAGFARLPRRDNEFKREVISSH